MMPPIKIGQPVQGYETYTGVKVYLSNATIVDFYPDKVKKWILLIRNGEKHYTKQIDKVIFK